jgi:hypothetical protein
LIQAGASEDVQYEVCKALISSLQDGDWDTAGEVVGEYEEHPAIVRAFRANNVILTCTSEYREDSEDRQQWFNCDLEQKHTEDHEDTYYHRKWKHGEGCDD